ncbi:hypothetical protein [Psychrobacter sp. UBA3480]|uniref:hypothetical protein n=1 Tax=Psychrobacter sp. UBA3480 TaxID=1947350 RepID=UPI0025F95F37|nr:hypothetical protein [Psychrobacter sp. UBA3480]
MSFLNPVSEPVRRFKSTDASAPQINYNARVAGDVYAILKACLVNGYGSVASAGWTVTNETANAGEFVSPSTSMSSYKIGISDTSATATTWYYKYLDVRTDPTNNSGKKVFSYIDKTSGSNGWQLLVTGRGFFFIESMYQSDIGAMVARVTYFGRVKSAITTTSGKNIAYWSVGHGASYQPYQLYSTTSASHFNLESYTNLTFSSANISGITAGAKTYGTSEADVVSKLYLYSGSVFAAEHPGFMAVDSAKSANLFGIRDTVDDNNRPMIYVCMGREVSSSNVEGSARGVLVYLDYWEY